jgi:hypothetical protein
LELRAKAMALNAAAVELLIEKGGFEPRVALGIAEAIETSMTQAQIVTVPILDARIQEFRADMRSCFQQLEIKLERNKIELEGQIERTKTELGAQIGGTKADLEAQIGRNRTDLEAQIGRNRTDLEAQIARGKAELETQIERSKAELVRWVFLVMLGNVALSAGATAIFNAFQHSR